MQKIQVPPVYTPPTKRGEYIVRKKGEGWNTVIEYDPNEDGEWFVENVEYWLDV